MMTSLIQAPTSDATNEITTLGGLEGYDAVLNDDYAFVIYKEVNRASNNWCVRVKARHLTGVVFEPEAMRLQARSAGAQGKPFFTWGNCIDPSAGDPRSVQYRVHVKDGKPSQIEVYLVTRKADHSAEQPKSVMVPWPA